MRKTLAICAAFVLILTSAFADEADQYFISAAYISAAAEVCDGLDGAEEMASRLLKLTAESKGMDVFEAAVEIFDPVRQAAIEEAKSDPKKFCSVVRSSYLKAQQSSWTIPNPLKSFLGNLSVILAIALPAGWIWRRNRTRRRT